MSKPEDQKKELPKVSCLTVTANRKNLIRRAIRCFSRQTYPNKELVIVDDGEQNIEEVLQSLPAKQLKYIKLPKKPGNRLGKLRNKTLREASGTFLAQWDDDDWYHPQRLSIQVQTLLEGYDACCLSGTLMHLNIAPYKQYPYLGYLPEGVPGSIMHRENKGIRYPNTHKAEDTIYLKEWMEQEYTQLSNIYSHLFIRCYHGSNTWDKKHFLRRIRNNPTDGLLYFWHKVVRGKLFEHPRFQLTDTQSRSFQMYLKDSR